MLPARMPNLLINGSAGIAVGMATNIPPHNLTETLNACVAVVDNPEITIDELMEIMPAPDFPTAGIIYGLEGVREGYRTGRGRVVIRARTHIEEVGNSGKQAIIVDELPYQVGGDAVLKRIGELVQDKKIEGISDLRNESDKKGMRLVIELKRGEVPEVVQNNLYKLTQLQDSFGMNMVALVDGQPRLLNLKQFIDFFLVHRREVITRRTIFDLRKARERGHVLEGLAVALSNVDEIIALIKASATPPEAKVALMSKAWRSPVVEEMLARATADAARPDGLPAEFGLKEQGYKLSEAQAQAILELRLQRLTGLEQDKITAEYRDVMEVIADLLDILARPERITQIVRDELVAIRNQFGDKRRSEIIAQGVDLSMEDLIASVDMVVTLSHGGYMKAQPVDEYRAQKRGGRGKRATATKEDDFVDRMFIANTHDFILCFSNRGRVYWLKVYNVPQGSRNSRGKPIVNLVPLIDDEKITAVLPVKAFTENEFVFMATAMGTVKKTPLSDFSRPRTAGIIAVDLSEGDSLIGVALTDGTHDVMLFSSGGKAVRFDENDVRPMGRNAHGVRGMALDPGQEVISMLVAEDEAQSVMTATENGYGKRTPIVEYTRHGRGTKGMIAIQQSERNGQVVAAALVHEDDEVMLISTARRPDPHQGQVDPRDGPLHAGRHADEPARWREARRASSAWRRRTTRSSQASPTSATTRKRPNRRHSRSVSGEHRRFRRTGHPRRILIHGTRHAACGRRGARRPPPGHRCARPRDPRAPFRARGACAGDRRAEGHGRGLSARARGAGHPRPARGQHRTAVQRGDHQRVPRGDVGLPRARADAAHRVPRPRGNVQPCRGGQAFRHARGGRALSDLRRHLPRDRGRAGRLRRGPGGKLDRGRGGPHARPHGRHRPLGVRRGQAAREPEPPVQREGPGVDHARVFARPVARAVRALARAAPAGRAAHRGGEQCRGRAARGGGAWRRGDRGRERRRDLRPCHPCAAHRGRAQQHHALLGARPPAAQGLRPRRDVARDVVSQSPRRRARSCSSPSRATACRCRASSRAPRAPDAGNTCSSWTSWAIATTRRSRPRSPSSPTWRRY